MKLLAGFLLVQALVAQVPVFRDADRKAKLLKAVPQVDALFQRYFEDRRAPGLAYGIVIDGELVHVKTFGVREIDGKSPVQPDTRFRIASMTKSFTALAILKLRDEGKLSLDDPASRFVPEMATMRYPTRDTAPITIRHLLTHGAGFPEDNPWGDRQLGIADAEMSRWVERGLPFSTPPGSAYEYSNYGFALLGRIVAKASGKPYDVYLNDAILRPLGMTASTLEPRRAPQDKVALGYGLRDGKYFHIPSLPHGAFGAMGGLLTTAEDLGRYVAFQLAAEPARDDADRGPVKRSSVREMQHPWRPSNFSATRTEATEPLRAVSSAYGYGLSVTKDCRFGRIVAHGGGLPGFGSYMMWLPEYGVGMFAMTNLTYSGPAAPMREGFELMAKSGALQPRQLPVSDVLRATQIQLTALWNQWNPQALDKLAADNLYLDEPRDRIAARFAALREKLHNCKPAGELSPENWLRGEFQLACDEGRVAIDFTLAPTNPPLIQYLRLREIGRPNTELSALAASAAAASPYGSCQLGEVLGTSDKSATWKLQCSGGAATVTVTPGAKPQFGRAPGNACTP
jgi:CubicO group peptidase (beta-lactamase class C family)